MEKHIYPTSFTFATKVGLDGKHQLSAVGLGRLGAMDCDNTA